MKSILMGTVAILLIAAVVFVSNFNEMQQLGFTVIIVLLLMIVTGIITDAKQTKIKSLENIINSMAGTINDFRGTLLQKNSYIDSLQKLLQKHEASIAAYTEKIKFKMGKIASMEIELNSFKYPFFNKITDLTLVKNKFYFKIHQGKDALWYMSIIGPDKKYRYSSKGYVSSELLLKEFNDIVIMISAMSIFDPHNALTDGFKCQGI